MLQKWRTFNGIHYVSFLFRKKNENNKMRSSCGGFVVNNTIIEWARTKSEFDANFVELNRYGVRPELKIAHGLHGRWKVVKEVIFHANVYSLLDVGGFGHYRAFVKKHSCINITPHKGCRQYEGTRLPYANSTFELVIIETVLHHAAEKTMSVLSESVRVSNKYVLFAEDVIDRRASSDVFRSYRLHDHAAIYRSSDEWVSLALLVGLKLYKLSYLHRVPIHVMREATKCKLGFAPMLYFWFTKKGV